MSDLEDFADKVKDLARELKACSCPVWQCGGDMEHIETDDNNWQEPDLKCKNCGAYFKFIGRD